MGELSEATSCAKKGMASIKLVENLQRKISTAESVSGISSDQLQESYDVLKNLKEKLKEEVIYLNVVF